MGYLYQSVGALFWDDNGSVSSSNVVVHVGGNYNQNQNHGLFYQNSNSVSNTNSNIGSRILGMITYHHGLFLLRRRFKHRHRYRAALAEDYVERGQFSTLERAQERLLDNKETITVKRVNHLWEKIISHDNLKEAIESVCRSHRWIHYPDKKNPATERLLSDIEMSIDELADILINGFEPSECLKKMRYDANAGKWRNIEEPHIWPDQCVHHALIQVLEPVMMRGMDYWCCGSIKGRGAHYGIRALKKWVKRKDTPYCIELDIRHFYDSIKPKYVIERFKHLIKDYRTLNLIERIIRNGVSIGSYCSQWFANTLLQPLDQIIRQTDATKYLRYMDNFTIFAKRKRTADKIIGIVMEWLAGLELKLKDNWQKFHRKYRIPNALGYRFGEGYTLLRKKNLLRLKRQICRFYCMRERGKFIPVKFAQGLLSRLGMLRHCSSFNIYKKFVPKHTQRHLKDILREYYRKEEEKWSISLEPCAEMA